MEWILYVLAAFCLCVFVILAVIYIKFIRPIRLAYKAVKDVAGLDFGDLENSPLASLMAEIPENEVYIQAYDEDDWEVDKSVAKKTGEFMTEGFERVGAFSGVTGFGPAEILIHPSGVFVMVGEADNDKGVKVRLMALLENDAAISVSDNEMVTLLPQNEGDLRIQRTSETVSSMMEDLESLREGRSLKVVTASNLITELKRQEKRRCMYLASNPEVVEAALNDLQDVKSVYILSVRQSLSELISDCCKEEYMSQADVTVLEWEDMRDRLVIVHDRSVAGSIIDQVEDNDIDLKSLDLAKIHEESAKIVDRDAYRHHLSKLPEYSRPQLIGNVVKPVEADIYLRN